MKPADYTRYAHTKSRNKFKRKNSSFYFKLISSNQDYDKIYAVQLTGGVSTIFSTRSLQFTSNIGYLSRSTSS